MKTDFTLQEVSEFSGIPVETLWSRAEKRQLPKRFKDNDISGTRQVRFFNLAEVNFITNNYTKEIPEVIYVTRTTEIIESSLRFLDLAECEKSISESKYKPYNKI